MTTGVINGTDLILYVDGVAIGGSQSHDLTLDRDLPDASTKDSAGWAENIGGQKSWSIDCSGLVMFDAAFGFEELFDLFESGELVTLVFGTQISGDVQFDGGARLSSLSESAGNEDSTSFSVSFTGSGPITKSNVT